MRKIIIVYGSDSYFNNLIPKTHRNLTDVAMQLDEDGKRVEMIHKIPGQPEEEPKHTSQKVRIRNFVVNADEYSSVQEHVVINFINFIAKLSITNMYIQNPPTHIHQQLISQYGDKDLISEKTQEYNQLTRESILRFHREYGNKIIGQPNAKEQILKAIFPVMENKQEKPVVIMFYGKSGLGKTETAQFLSEIIGGKLFRKQFSMFQNNEFASYLFGGRYDENSFAKDLLARDSNIILLDEFDKAYPVFHSAFYQLFDEGIFEDQNYKVRVKHSIIICTSNYQSIEEIRNQLGDPMYNRFDAVIRFNSLSDEDKVRIANDFIQANHSLHRILAEYKEKLLVSVKSCDNAREIQRLVKDTAALLEIRKICKTDFSG